MVLSATVFAASGCASEARSCDLDTSALLMWATVTDLGVEVEVEVEFEAFGAEGAALTLCPDRDVLQINGVAAKQVHALGHVYYLAEFEGMPKPQYTISLARDGADSLTAVVDMPPPFEIITPEPMSSHSRATPLGIEWAPGWAGEVIEVAVEDAIGSDCLDDVGVRYEVDDTGTYTIGGSSLGGAGMGDCEVTLALSRHVIADYPPQLHEGGEIDGFVRRRRPFTSTD